MAVDKLVNNDACNTGHECLLWNQGKVGGGPASWGTRVDEGGFYRQAAISIEPAVSFGFKSVKTPKAELVFSNQSEGI